MRWTATLDFPDFEEDYEFVALSQPGDYPLERGRLASSAGLDIGPAQYEEHFEEHQVPHSTALHSRLRERGSYLVGPLARYALNHERLSPLAREAAAEAGLQGVCRNPFRSIVVRAVEILYAFDEALRIIAGYEEPEAPAVEVAPRAGTRLRLDRGAARDALAPLPPRRGGSDPRGEDRAPDVAEPAQDRGGPARLRGPQHATRPTTSCVECASRSSATTTRASRAATHFLTLQVDRE